MLAFPPPSGTRVRRVAGFGLGLSAPALFPSPKGDPPVLSCAPGPRTVGTRRSQLPAPSLVGLGRRGRAALIPRCSRSRLFPGGCRRRRIAECAGPGGGDRAPRPAMAQAAKQLKKIKDIEAQALQEQKEKEESNRKRRNRSRDRKKKDTGATALPGPFLTLPVHGWTWKMPLTSGHLATFYVKVIPEESLVAGRRNSLRSLAGAVQPDPRPGRRRALPWVSIEQSFMGQGSVLRRPRDPDP
ncbi:hypothetical protein NN561_015951 [Cricetulus griseus]